MLDRIIFEVDHIDFVDYVKYMKPNVIICKGKYKDELAISMILNRKDFDELPSSIIKDQESFLIIPAEGELDRQPAYLEYRDGTEEILGKFTHVSKEEAEDSDGYTQVLSTGKYFICK